MNVKFLFKSSVFVLLLYSTIIFFCTDVKKENNEYTVYLFTYFTDNGDAEEAISYAIIGEGYSSLLVNNESIQGRYGVHEIF